MVNNLLSNAEDMGLIPSWETKIPQATGNQAHELQPREAHVSQWRSSAAINQKKKKKEKKLVTKNYQQDCICWYHMTAM